MMHIPDPGLVVMFTLLGFAAGLVVGTLLSARAERLWRDYALALQELCKDAEIAVPASPDG